MKILVISPYAYSFWQFRGELLKAMVDMGHDVYAIAPDDDGHIEAEKFGLKYIHVPFNRNGMNPIKDIKLIFKFSKKIKELKPDLVFSYAIKPVIYGSIAAQLSGINNIYSLVPGIGFLFNSIGLKASILRRIVSFMYKTAFSSNQKVFFQNPDNQDEFVKRNIIEKKKCIIVNGSGINLDKFKPCELPKENRFLMIARVLKDKGVREFVDAAKIVKMKYPDTLFQFLGPFDTNPAAIQEEAFMEWISDGSVQYLGKTNDVRPYIAATRVFVLPSYHEGTPHTSLEAMAMKRPVITTNAAGCKETVIDGVTGFVVNVKDSKALADKMIYMIENPELCESMAEAGLSFCIEKYDVNKVNSVMLTNMNIN